MGPNLLHRIRWGNVGRLAGALAVIAAVAAWPRLAPPEPALPGEAAQPLDGLGPTPAATPPAELLGPRPPRVVRRRARRSGAKPDRKGARAVRPAERGRGRERRAGNGGIEERRTGGGGSTAPGADRGDEPGGGGMEREPRLRERGATPRLESDPAATEFGFEQG